MQEDRLASLNDQAGIPVSHPGSDDERIRSLLRDISAPGHDEPSVMQRLQDYIDAEHALVDEAYVESTRARLRALLEMDASSAMQAASRFEEAMVRAPGEVAVRRVAAVQTAAQDFSGRAAAPRSDPADDLRGDGGGSSAMTLGAKEPAHARLERVLVAQEVG